MLSDNLREKLVYRILSGKIRLTRYGKDKEILVIKSAPPIVKYEAAELYEEVLELANYHEVLSDGDIDVLLLKNKLWDAAKEQRLLDLPKEMEDAKVELYEIVKNSGQTEEIRLKLLSKKAAFNELYAERHTYDYLTKHGFASHIRNKFILGRTTYKNGKRYKYESEADYDVVMGLLAKNRIDETEIRELARSEPFRSYWYLSKNGNLFGEVSLYTEDQKTLCSWARLYDSVYESNEAPPERVINDDDALDGWLITERKKREGNTFKKEAENTFIKNPKIKNAREVFIVANPKEGRTVAKIEAMNDSVALFMKRQRMMVLQEKGTVRELDMPDVRLELMKEANEAINKRMKG